jgi:membrane-bound lytic murein transglycosylase MltF
MSCYTRHLTDIIEELGIENNIDTRRIIDRQIRRILKKQDANCPEVWRDVKERIHDPEQKKKLVSELKKTISKD